MLLEGTAKHSKKELQILLDEIGASLSFGATNERLVWRAQVRTRHLEKLLSLISEILLCPAFPASELAIVKKREEASLALEAQDTNTQAGIAFSRMLYAQNHPNFNQKTEESLAALKKISVKTLEAYHTRVLNRGSLVLSAAGEVQIPSLAELVQKYFEALPAKKAAVSKTFRAAAPKAGRKAVHIKEKASIDYFTGIATRITNTGQDFAALVLGLQILGDRGGFNGRLMRIVREKEGLTYAVYSYPSGFAHDTDGYALAWGTFAPQLFAKGRAAILREIRRIVSEGAGEEEVRKHGKLFEARAKVSLSSAGALARAAHDTVVDKKALSRLDAFPRQVAKLTAKEVNRALKKYLKLDKLSEAAAGPIERF